MIKFNKKILSRLAAINNPAVTQQLQEYATKIRDYILATDDNDEIFVQLDFLEQFVYRVPDVSLEIIKYIFNNPKPIKNIQSPIGVYDGKSHSDIIEKCIDLLSAIRYAV